MNSNNVNGQIVNTVRKVKLDDSQKTRETLRWGFDFTGCKQEFILSLAVDSLVIIVQRIWRAKPNSDRKSMLTKTFMVTDILTGLRQKVDHKEKTKNAAKKLFTKSELLAMAAEMPD